MKGSKASKGKGRGEKHGGESEVVGWCRGGGTAALLVVAQARVSIFDRFHEHHVRDLNVHLQFRNDCDGCKY